MKSKKLAAFVVALFACTLIGCGEAEPTQEPTIVEPEIVGLANPWHDCSEEEANQICPRLFKLPDGATNARWSIMDDLDPSSLPGEIVQVIFDLDGMEFTARACVTGDEEDENLSGTYYDWTVTDDVHFSVWGDGAMTGKSYRYIGENEAVDLITWYDVEIGISYSLSTEAKDLDGFDIQAIAEQMYDESKYTLEE